MATHLTNYEETLEAAGRAFYEVLVARHLENPEPWEELSQESRDDYKAKGQPIVQAILDVAELVPA